MQTPSPAPARFAVLRASSTAPLLPAQPPTSHAIGTPRRRADRCDAWASGLARHLLSPKACDSVQRTRPANVAALHTPMPQSEGAR